MGLLQGVQAVASGREGLVFVGSSRGLSIFNGGGRDAPLELVTQSDPPAISCTNLAVGLARMDELDVHIITATLDTGTCI